MTTATRPLLGHGTRACYLRGCRRPECLNAHYRYMSRYRLDRQRGQQRRVDSQPAAEHVRTLLNTGWNQRQIADAAGCAHRIIGDLTRDRFPNILRSTSNRVLAITPGPPPPAIQYTNPTGTIRRIQALVAIGWPFAHIAPAVGIHVTVLGNIARSTDGQVRVTTARAVADVYRQLRWKPGPSPRARKHAIRNGWHSPLAWDGNIDDPTAVPDVDIPPDPELKRDELAALRRDEIWLLGTACIDPEEIAQRLGIATSTAKSLLAEIRTGKKRDRKPVAA